MLSWCKFAMDHIVRLLLSILSLLWRPFTGATHALQDRFRRVGKSDWPTVTGRVHSSHISSNEHTWTVTLLYSYRAEGDYWSGETTRPFFGERDAENYADMHRADSPLMVRVCPGQPGQSTVLVEDQMFVSPAASI